MKLLILSQMTSENISEFFSIILVGISEYWDALFSFNSIIFVSISLKLTFLKLKTPFPLLLVLIARMLGCFLYLRIAFKVASLIFSIIGSKSEYWEMLRFFKVLPKNLKKPQLFFFQCSQFYYFHSNLSFLWHWIFRIVKALLFSKKVCYQKRFFHLNFHSKFF